MSPAARPGPLDGVRVLDITSVVMGPLATQILGDLGADVITVESARGEMNRRLGPGRHPELSDVALNLLRNKRNVAIDLKDPAGREAILRVARSCEIVVTNLRPGPLRRLGLDYDAVRAQRPDVIFCRATGFAADDERAEEPAYDDIIQAAAGAPDVMAKATGEARFMPTLLADKVSGLAVANAILAAYVHRQRTGEGQLVDVAMLDAVSAFLMVEHGSGSVTGSSTVAGYRRILSPHRRPQRARDGLVVIFPYLPEHWEALLVEAGLDELVGDERLSARRTPDPAFVYETLGRVAATKAVDEWLAFCRERRIPATAAPTIEEVVATWDLAEHPVAGPYRSAPAMARLHGTPATVRRPAPLPGEHNREVLAEAGLSGHEIDELERRGVLRRPPPPGPSTPR